MTSSSTASSQTPQVQPQILTRALLPSIIQLLDASDVLECYALVRSAPLHQPHFNSTVVIQKMAVGLRYRATTWSAHKTPLELTLEYGPQRSGELLSHEAMPFVSADGDYVTWENEGHVYVTKSIGTEWKHAYYMASLTGAVLAKLLDRAIGYMVQHTRYQPFQVMSSSSPPKVLLKSSSAQDFVYTMWQELASVGVELKPILPPPMYDLVLHVDSIVKISGYELIDYIPASIQASSCFDKLSHCMTAVATGEYTRFTPTMSPTSAMPSSTPTTNASTSIPSQAPSMLLLQSQAPFSTPTMLLPQSQAPSVGPTIQPTLASTNRPTIRPTPLFTQLTKKPTIEKTQLSNNATNDKNSTLLRRIFDRFLQSESSSSFDSIVTLDDYANDTFANTTIPEDDVDEGDEAFQAVKAAQVAVSAAQDAKNFSSSEASQKAADAAEAAAAAAQKAADATAYTASQQMKSYINSGDGVLMPAAIRQCFTNPQYGIAVPGHSGVVVYLYLDGSFYYQLNLTDPYLSVMLQDRPLPQPPSFMSNSVYARGDFFDWTLAVGIGMLVCVGILMILQQVGVRVFFHKMQRNFFDPHARDDDATRDNNNHDFDDWDLPPSTDDDTIPWSMSGRGGASHGRSSKVVVSPILELVERNKRDPDFVDLPHLKSTSKVAIPASMESFDDSDDLLFGTTPLVE